MAITGEKIYEFTYIKFDDTMCPDQIKSYASTKLIHIESKHVAFLDNNTKIFFELSEKVNYGNTVLGIHRNAIRVSFLTIFYNIFYIFALSI